MRQIEAVPELREAVKEGRQAGGTVGFVPTMGCLHAGHTSLLRAAREDNDLVVASIFVNPTQFGPGEDFGSYPRQLEADLRACEAAGVDIVYTPKEDTMYPPGFSTFVQEELLAMPLCGRGRPGHFRGVCTVVSKLFHQVLPDRAYFGQKDAQQALVIRRMVRDLDFPVEVRIRPIVRDADGLALSSRNRYLSETQRTQALALRESLWAIEKAFEEGTRDAEQLAAVGLSVLDGAEGIKVEYLEVLDPENLVPTAVVSGTALVSVAARVGPARLIDNSVLDGQSGRVRSNL